MAKGINKSKYIASSFIILQCLIFGFSFVATKELLAKSFPTFLLLAIRFAVGGVVLTLIGILFKKSPKISTTVGAISKLKKKEIVGGTISGVLLFCAFALQTFGLEYTTPAKSGLFTDLFVIFVPIITMVLTRRFNWQPIVAGIIAFVGATFVLNVYSEKSDFNVGDVLSISCGFMFAVQFIVMEKFAMTAENERVNPFNFTCIQLAIVSILALIASLFFEIKLYANINWNGVIWLICFLGVFAAAAAYLLQFMAQTKISAETTSVLSCSEALFTVIISLVFRFDTFSWWLILGGVMLIGGMVFAVIPLKNK